MYLRERVDSPLMSRQALGVLDRDLHLLGRTTQTPALPKQRQIQGGSAGHLIYRFSRAIPCSCPSNSSQAREEPRPNGPQDYPVSNPRAALRRGFFPARDLSYRQNRDSPVQTALLRTPRCRLERGAQTNRVLAVTSG